MWSDGLEGEALKIASSGDGCIRVMAGPGTGKTFSMMRRISRLLEEGVSPDSIFAVTFTRVAADNLKRELKKISNKNVELIKCSTLHSFCFSLLQKEEVFMFLSRIPRPILSFNKSGIKQFEARPMLEDIRLETDDFGSNRNCTKRILAFEAAWARLQNEIPGWPEEPIDRLFHLELIKWLTFHEAILIGELIPLVLNYLRSNPTCSILNQFTHVIVDEYQDLTKAEQVLIDLLACNGNLFIVGDENQSVYSFRYANPEGIHEFFTRHDNLIDYPLIVCRRCPKLVTSIANNMILVNHPEIKEPILSPYDDAEEGDVHVIQWDTLEDEIKGLSHYIKHIINTSEYLPSDILVLTNSRFIGYEIKMKLLSYDIAAHSYFYEELVETEDAQESIAFLTLLTNRDDRVALRCLLGFGDKKWRSNDYRLIQSYCRDSNTSPWALLNDILNNTIDILKESKIKERYQKILDRISIFESLTTEQIISDLFPEDSSWTTPFRELYSEDMEPLKFLNKIRTYITQPQMPPEVDFVRIMSLHKSKGLSSKMVIIASCIQGLIPRLPRDATLKEKERFHQEQRRLFYVSITRCIKELIISSHSQINRELAHRIGAIVSRRGGTPDIGNTIASTFISEFGKDAPATQNARLWLSSLLR